MDESHPSTGVINSLFIKPEHGAPMLRTQKIKAIANRGLEGDQAFNHQSRQVLLVDLKQVKTLGLQPGQLRENITVDGIPLDSLPPGTKLKTGQVVLRLVEVSDPCKKLEDIRPGLMRASQGSRGMLAVVERTGTLSEGSPIIIV